MLESLLLNFFKSLLERGVQRLSSTSELGSVLHLFFGLLNITKLRYFPFILVIKMAEPYLLNLL